MSDTFLTWREYGMLKVTLGSTFDYITIILLQVFVTFSNQPQIHFSLVWLYEKVNEQDSLDSYYFH